MLMYIYIYIYYVANALTHWHRLGYTVINGVLTAPFCRRKKFKVGGAVYTRYTKKKKKKKYFFFFKVLIYAPSPGAMPGSVSQLSNRCVDSPLGN